MRLTSTAPLLIGLLNTALPLHAQQNAGAGVGTTPRPPRGFVIPPLPEAPAEYVTAEGLEIRVAVIARGLTNPWSIAFLPDGTALVTERAGRLRAIRNGVLDPTPLAGVPAVRAVGLSGLFDVKLHPDFARNRYLYLSYEKPMGDRGAVAVARGTLAGNALTDVTEIFVTEDTSSICRLLFGPDGKLYVSTFGAFGEAAQDPKNLTGKVLRLNDDGSVPDDNPFADDSAYRPEVYTLGHRSPEGMVVHAGTGQIWEVEMGPNGGDEVNVLRPGANYGWPLISLGRSYEGPWQGKFTREGFEDPVVYWMPSISTSGIEFYTGDRLPQWKGDLFVGGMRYGEIPGTGQLHRIRLNENREEIRREALFGDRRHRIRDVRQGPDELLYLLVDDASDGAVLRIEPAE
jgi:glucose/arabinose dehydrogenase